MAEPRVAIDRRGYAPPRSVSGCGTYAGVSAHNAAREPLCDDCRRARSDYIAQRRFRSGLHHDPRRCRQCGSVFPEHRCAMED